MFLSRILSSRMREDRIKLRMAAVRKEGGLVVARFEGIDREPTQAEREARLVEFLANRKELGELERQLAQLKCW